MSQPFVRTGITFDRANRRWRNIGKEMLAKGVVHDSYPQALVEREASFLTGIVAGASRRRYPLIARRVHETFAIYLGFVQILSYFNRRMMHLLYCRFVNHRLIVENPAAQLKTSCAALVSYRTQAPLDAPVKRAGCRTGDKRFQNHP